MKNFIIGFLLATALSMMDYDQVTRAAKEGFDKDRGKGQKVKARVVGFKG